VRIRFIRKTTQWEDDVIHLVGDEMEVDNEASLGRWLRIKAAVLVEEQPVATEEPEEEASGPAARLLTECNLDADWIEKLTQHGLTTPEAVLSCPDLMVIKGIGAATKKKILAAVTTNEPPSGDE